jgi:hypothetical protein
MSEYKKEKLNEIYMNRFENIKFKIDRLRKIEDIESQKSNLRICEKALKRNDYENICPELKYEYDMLVEQLENKEFDYYRNSTKYTLTRLFYKDGRINENLKFTLSMIDKINGYIRTFKNLDLEDGDLWNEMYNTNDFSIDRLDDYMNNLTTDKII